MSEINQMTDNWEERLEPIYSNDTELTKDICDFLKCSEYKHGNESEPTACYGCDAMYGIFYQEEKRIIEDDDKYNYIQSLLDKKAEEVAKDCYEEFNTVQLAVLNEINSRPEHPNIGKQYCRSWCLKALQRIKQKYIKGESNGRR